MTPVSFPDLRYWVARTYGARNAKIGTERLLGSVDATLSRLSKGIRTGELEESEARIEIARLMSRVVALEAQLHVDVLVGIQGKYPGYCGYCWYKQCRCRRRAKAPEPPNDAYLPLPEAPISDLQRMFAGIYGFRNALAGAGGVLQHLFEEAGEVRRAIEREPRSAIQVELTDVCAHGFGFANVVGINVQRVVTERYRDGCPECHYEVCDCSLDQ